MHALHGAIGAGVCDVEDCCDDEAGDECDSGSASGAALADTLRARPALLQLLVACEQRLSGSTLVS
jgi:hypothetical protein